MKHGIEAPETHLKLYRYISRLRWPKSFTGKLMLVAFVGVHIPLIATVAFAVIWMRDTPFPMAIIITCLLATLVGTGLTLWIQSHMLAPVRKTSEALKDFNSKRLQPSLPLNYSDEVGVLMAETQRCLSQQAALLELKNRFFRTLSHDLRSPLASIVDACTLLEMEKADLQPDERDRLISHIKSSATEQLDLIQSLLRLAIAEGSREEVSVEPVDVQQLLDSAYNQVSSAAEIRKVKLHVRNPENTNLEVMGDRRLIGQILNNFVSNSIKHTPADGQVTLSAEVRGQCVRLKVEDNGQGLSQDQVTKIREGGGLNSSAGAHGEIGIGLGLQICHDCARLLGTTVQVESTPGEGSTFFIELPNSTTSASVSLV